MTRPAPVIVVLVGVIAVLAGGLRAALADNAGFALAPKGSEFAFDARELATLLGRENATGVRPIIEALAGRDALVTFDALAQRCNAAGDVVAQEVFAGRVAFTLVDVSSGPSWIFGIEADDDRCARVLTMLGAKMRAPGIFDAPVERVTMRRVGGWLLVSPSQGGDEALAAASRRVAVEDAESSLLGEPLAQQLLVSDAPVRIFVRHDPPIGGATTIGVRAREDGNETRGGLRAEIDGRYDDPPLGEPNVVAPLDGVLIGAFEERAVFVVSNPATGRPGSADAFWLALVPELRPTPTMRANLSGERLVVLGSSQGRTSPAMAVAWRVDDAAQATHDQDQHMRGVLCGLARGIEGAAVKPQESVGPSDAAVAPIRPTSRTSEPEFREPTASVRSSPVLGPFLDRYLGKPLKLGDAVLCWETVPTPCGGWQVYASDPAWMADVARELVRSSCSKDGKQKAGGLGFCDGPRAADVLRRWRPLASDQPEDRVARGIEALATTIAGLGRLRFSYIAPGPGRLQATVELEPLGRLLRESGALSPVRRSGATEGGTP